MGTAVLRPRATGGLVAVLGMLGLAALSLADPRHGAGRTDVGPAPAASAVQVAVVGDFGMDDPHEAAVAEMVAGWDPDLVVTTGDNYYLGGEEPGTDRYDRTVGRY